MKQTYIQRKSSGENARVLFSMIEQQAKITGSVCVVHSIFHAEAKPIMLMTAYHQNSTDFVVVVDTFQTNVKQDENLRCDAHIRSN